MCESYSLTVSACVAVVTVLLTSGAQAGVVRRYYVAAQEVDWHYTAGYQVNLLNVKDTGWVQVSAKLVKSTCQSGSQILIFTSQIKNLPANRIIVHYCE